MSGVVSQPFQHFLSQVPVRLRAKTIAVSGATVMQAISDSCWNCFAYLSYGAYLAFRFLCDETSASSCIATRMHFSVCRRCLDVVACISRFTICGSQTATVVLATDSCYDKQAL